MKMLLNAISKDFDSFKAEIEKGRNDLEFEIDDVSPLSPTECMNTPVGGGSVRARFTLTKLSKLIRSLDVLSTFSRRSLDVLSTFSG